MMLIFSTALGNAIVDLINSYVNSGSGAGKIRFYAAADTTYTTILAEVTLQDPAFSLGSGGGIILQGTPLSDASANNSGTVGVFRFVDSDNNFEFRGTCSLSGGGGDMILSTLAVTAGQVFTVSTCTIAVPVSAT